MTVPGAKTLDDGCVAIAATWALRLQEPNVSEATMREWLAWCEADSQNRTAFEKIAEVWAVSGHLKADDFAVASIAANDDAKVPSFGRRSAAIAASAMLMAATFTVAVNRDTLWPADEAKARFQTDVGRVQAARLKDGSTIELGGNSKLSVRYTKTTRHIAAEAGEAFFDVAKDSSRPFIVDAGSLTVTAIGTAFSVQRDGNSVSVLVTEGVVKVEPTNGSSAFGGRGKIALHISAGHRVRLDEGKLTQSLEPVPADVVKPWREGRLEFRDEPLRLVVARINRYSTTKLEISDGSIADLRLTTTVYQDRLDPWLSGLSAVLPVRISHHEKRVVIAPAIGPQSDRS